MLTKKDLRALAETRLEDARHLVQAGRYSAAYYLAGYSVELGIKACIAGLFLADAIPEKSFVNAIYSHKLEGLLSLAGMKKNLDDEMRNDEILSTAWAVASQWDETSRYAMWDQFAAASMIDAVGDQNHGVLQWLKKHW